jgi:hypothetical protein
MTSHHVPRTLRGIELERALRIPKEPGADWRDLPNEEVSVSCAVGVVYEYSDDRNSRL